MLKPDIKELILNIQDIGRIESELSKRSIIKLYNNLEFVDISSDDLLKLFYKNSRFKKSEKNYEI
jgi:hypothetical protein